MTWVSVLACIPITDIFFSSQGMTCNLYLLENLIFFNFFNDENAGSLSLYLFFKSRKVSTFMSVMLILFFPLPKKKFELKCVVY